MVLLESGRCDAIMAGADTAYPQAARKVLRFVGTAPGHHRAAGMHLVRLRDRTLFFADTTLNVSPDAETLAGIALAAAQAARRLEVEPVVGMLSFANFGESDHPEARKVADAVRILRTRAPELSVIGEIQADWAVSPDEFADLIPHEHSLLAAGQRADLSQPFGRECGLPVGARDQRGRGDRAAAAGLAAVGRAAAARRNGQGDRADDGDRWAGFASGALAGCGRTPDRARCVDFCRAQGAEVQLCWSTASFRNAEIGEKARAWRREWVFPQPARAICGFELALLLPMLMGLHARRLRPHGV